MVLVVMVVRVPMILEVELASERRFGEGGSEDEARRREERSTHRMAASGASSSVLSVESELCIAMHIQIFLFPC